ncbi:MAG: c-type cytochrome [Alphaproteobacteria bacterium]
MVKKLGLFSLALAAIAAGVFWFLTQPNPLPPGSLPAHQADLENGRTMFWAGGCASCHAKVGAKTDAERFQLAGGLALETPFGTFVAPNISPSKEAGIGGWTNLEFASAMTRGVAPDGRHYYPAFPYTFYQRMKRVDLIDLKGFLDTLPSVENVPPPHRLRFPFTLRRGLGLWKQLFLDGKTFTLDPARDGLANRGAYLVNGPGHCAACHTPRNLIGGLDRSRWLAGAPLPTGKGHVPNITPHKDGLGAWSEKDIAFALETGFTPDFDTFGGAMVEVQKNLAKLPVRDRQAIARYLKSVTALPTTSAQKTPDDGAAN